MRRFDEEILQKQLKSDGIYIKLKKNYFVRGFRRNRI